MVGLQFRLFPLVHATVGLDLVKRSRHLNQPIRCSARPPFSTHLNVGHQIRSCLQIIPLCHGILPLLLLFRRFS